MSNKFNAKPAISQSKSGEIITFHSTIERDRFDYLSKLELAGEISNLELQPQFEILENFKFGKKKLIGIKYTADFSYYIGDKFVVEDVKGIKQRDFAMRLKLLLKKYLDSNLFLKFLVVTRKGASWQIEEYDNAIHA